MQVLQTQKVLQRLGFDPGPLDGIFGRLTAAALEQFQRKHKLPLTGLPDERTTSTLMALAGNQPETAGLVWLEEARRFMGLKEVAGGGSNRTILNWAKDLDIHYPGDDIPWCGLFVGHCIGATLPNEALPNNPLGARNWLKFGTPCEPKLGAVLVFWRGSRDGWMGHVAFYDGEDATAFYCLGGNQRDSVSIARISKKRLLGARWPTKAAAIASGPYLRDGAGEMSDDEA